jgi:chromate transporter
MTDKNAAVSTEAPAAISFADAFRFWLKLGFISFGGPAPKRCSWPFT